MELEISTRAKIFLKELKGKKKLNNMSKALDYFLENNGAIAKLPPRKKIDPIDLQKERAKKEIEILKARKTEIENRAASLLPELSNEYNEIAKKLGNEKGASLSGFIDNAESKKAEQIKKNIEAKEKIDNEAKEKREKSSKIEQERKDKEEKLEKKKVDDEKIKHEKERNAPKRKTG